MYKYRIRRRISKNSDKDILLKEGKSIKIEFVIQQREKYFTSNIFYNIFLIILYPIFIFFYLNQWEDIKICNTLVEAVEELNKIDPKIKIERTIKY